MSLSPLKDFSDCSEKGKIHSQERTKCHLAFTKKHLQFLLNSHNEEWKSDLFMSKLCLSLGSKTMQLLIHL